MWVVELARACLRQQLHELCAHAAVVVAGDDPEAVHKMRVATRRLRVFEDLLPLSATDLRRELKWLAGTLGAVRDLDVQRSGAWAMRGAPGSDTCVQSRPRNRGRRRLGFSTIRTTITWLAVVDSWPTAFRRDWCLVPAAVSGASAL
jgi:hypothetical protein